MIRAMIVTLSALALIGCASQALYSKDGSTPDDLERDVAGCRNKLAMVPVPATNENSGGLEAFGAGLTAYANKEQFMQDCLREEGWIRQHQ